MNTVSYTYDGSFYGLLTVIYEIYYSHSIPVAISIEGLITDVQESFFNTTISIETDMVKAEKVNEAILHKISADALENIYHVYLSSIKGRELIIYNYIKLGFRLGRSVESHLYTEEVAALHKILKKVNRELIYIIGFIRFIQVNNFYYAKYEPDHNITELI
jgi:probable DNA metabolism protein